VLYARTTGAHSRDQLLEVPGPRRMQPSGLPAALGAGGESIVAAPGTFTNLTSRSNRDRVKWWTCRAGPLLRRPVPVAERWFRRGLPRPPLHRPNASADCQPLSSISSV